MKKDFAVFAAGCFWGVEYYFQNTKGVISTTVGYTGGNLEDPTYQDVYAGTTGHYEAIFIKFNVRKTNFEQLCKLFFEIHDLTQTNGQGPDIGDQYKSAIFFKDDEQKEIAQKLIAILTQKGFNVATNLIRFEKFWEAEEHQQKYYKKIDEEPYCHFRRKIF